MLPSLRPHVKAKQESRKKAALEAACVDVPTTPVCTTTSASELSRLPATSPSRPALGKAQCEALRRLYEKECATAEARRQQADMAQSQLATLGAACDRFGLPCSLLPHDIPIVTLDGALTSEALRQLLADECCAVHVRGFCPLEMCAEIKARLRAHGEAFSNWQLNKSAQNANVPTEVDKMGVTSGNALDSFELFTEYLSPSSPTRLDALFPGELNPFTRLRAALDAAHTQGCNLNKLGGWAQPAGTFRRMRSSQGLIHADTATLLHHGSGQFSANMYFETPAGRGALSVYPAQQYADEKGKAPVELMAKLQNLGLKQLAGFDKEAQDGLRAALPLQRTMHVRDGDLCLINTGRFHRVEPYMDEQLRLSGQCWISYKKGHALRIWV
jgi:hypothetical protein